MSREPSMATEGRVRDRERRLALGEAAAGLPDFARSLGLPVPAAGTLDTLRAMIGALPPGAALPRLASDTEGCVLMRWADASGGSLAITLDEATVHATLRPGSASTHLAPFAWDGAWPAVLLEAMGSKESPVTAAP